MATDTDELYERIAAILEQARSQVAMRQFYLAFPEGTTIRDPQIVAALRRQSVDAPIVEG